MRAFIRNLELILTIAGLLIVFVATLIAESKDVDPWHAAAITAIAVGVIHGLLFWAVRSRQRRVREAVLKEIQAMLSDIINNQLTIIESSNHLDAKESNRPKSVSSISEAVQTISSSLKNLSAESLRKWQIRYGRSPEA